MLGAIKGVKLSGLSTKLSTIISNPRLAEISAAGLYRSMLIYVVTLSYTPNTLAPIITFGAYTAIAAKQGTVLDSTRIFTSLSLLSLITEPLNQLFHALPECFAAVACFGRIQAFLFTEPRRDTRECRQSSRPSMNADSSASNDEISGGIELKEHSLGGAISTTEKHTDAVTIQEGVFGWKQDEPPILREVNLRIAASQLTIVIGQVGCGKTTLLKAILGETPVAQGSVLLSS